MIINRLTINELRSMFLERLEQKKRQMICTKWQRTKTEERQRKFF